MRRIALALILLCGVATAQPARMEPSEIAKATEAPEVVLLTFGVGARIFEKFGHAALCLDYKSSNAEPVCFNYGVTDFQEGYSMIWHFLRTEQKFWVDPESWTSMTRFYEWEDRDIFMQPLPLTTEQAREIEDKLFHDIKNENRYYYYDHFFDNCTTRLRDMIDHATGGKLREGSDVAYPLTFRQIGFRGIAELPPLKALSDFVLGRQLDDTPTLWQAMFHPDVLRQQVELKLGVKPRLINKRRGPKFPTDGSTDRAVMFGIALVFAVPLLIATWRRRWHKAALVWATLFLAGWGFVIWTLVCISSIPGVRWNENVFVFVPLDVALPFLGAALRQRYARIRVALLLLVSALCAVGLLHQPLWIPILSAILPLSIIAFDLPHPLLRKLASDTAGA